MSIICVLLRKPIKWQEIVFAQPDWLSARVHKSLKHDDYFIISLSLSKELHVFYASKDFNFAPNRQRFGALWRGNKACIISPNPKLDVATGTCCNEVWNAYNLHFGYNILTHSVT